MEISITDVMNKNCLLFRKCRKLYKVVGTIETVSCFFNSFFILNVWFKLQIVTCYVFFIYLILYTLLKLCIVMSDIEVIAEV